MLILAASARMWAQEPSQRVRHGWEVDPAQFLKLPGEVLSRGRNEVPTGPLKVKTYRLERVKLDPPLELTEGTVTQYAYHLRITGGPFVYAYTVWIDGVAYPAYAAGSDQIVVQWLSSAAKFRDGATLSVTQGPGTCGSDIESVLPEKLSVPADLRAEPKVMAEARLRTTDDEVRGKRYVAVQVPSQIADATRNLALELQIGRWEFHASGGNRVAGALVPYDEFVKIPDGAPIVVKYGICQPGGEFAGRLNKSLLDR